MTNLRLVPRDNEQPIARVHGIPVLPSAFIADILACADALPNQQHVINLCTDRYWFMVSFFAAIVRGQINLLPSKRSEPELQGLLLRYPNCYRLTDNNSEVATDHQVGGAVANQGHAVSPLIDPDLCTAIAFTSGSTGTPKAHKKSWAMLCEFRQWHWDHLPGPTQLPRGLVATVPAWHMYGLEWAMLLPTTAPVTVHCGADFYPSDLVQALDNFDGIKTLLVATPTHLRALLKAPKPRASVHTTLSATAPLDATLVSAIESQLGTRLLEIYGCSEIGSLAWRAPSGEPTDNVIDAKAQNTDSDWTFFEGLQVTPLPASEPDKRQTQGSQLQVNCTHLANPVTLGDRFLATTPGRYQVLGRTSDMVKVAGKRESLANLNHILLSIPGVDDGIIYDPKHYEQPSHGRLAALVVAPKLNEKQLRTALSKKIDNAFVPRPIRRVEQLPRAATSKLSHQAITALLNEIRQHS